MIRNLVTRMGRPLAISLCVGLCALIAPAGCRHHDGKVTTTRSSGCGGCATKCKGCDKKDCKGCSKPCGDVKIVEPGK